MAKSKTFGVNLYHKRTRRKRPGRHSKNPNKRFTRKKYKGQGKL